MLDSQTLDPLRISHASHGVRSWLRCDRYRVECRWHLCPLTKLLTPADEGVQYVHKRRIFISGQKRRVFGRTASGPNLTSQCQSDRLGEP